MPSILLKCPAQRLTKTLMTETLITDHYRVPHPANVYRVDETRFRITWTTPSVPSATIHLPYPIEGHDRQIVSTSTLVAKETGLSYHLPTELLRGTLSILRNQLFEWEQQGLRISQTVQERLDSASLAFRAVLTAPDATRDDLADAALKTAFDMSRFLTDTYTDQALTARRAQGAWFPVRLGGVIGPDTPLEEIAPAFWQAFNTAVVSTPWNLLADSSDVPASEALDAAKPADPAKSPDPAPANPWLGLELRLATASRRASCVFAGPIISFDPEKIPPGTPITHQLKRQMIDQACEHLTRVVKRYQHNVDRWILADGFAQPWLGEMTPEDRVDILGQLIIEFRGIAPHTPCLLAFDQPWGEYLAKGGETEPPFRWADALLQAMPDLDGIVLEINLADHPHASRSRPPLAFAKMIDYWSCLGLPLYLSISVPGGEGIDPLARCETRHPDTWDWTPRHQQEWIHRFIRLMLTKPPVAGIFWNSLCDSVPHDFPHAGLFDAENKPKPGLKKLTGIRKAFLE